MMPFTRDPNYATHKSMGAKPRIHAVVSPPEPDLAGTNGNVPKPVVAHRRTTWKPVTEPGDGALLDSKFSGIAAVPSGEDWPTCPNCDNPMQLFLQLNSSHLPTGAPRFGSGLLQLFYCTNQEPQCEVDCEAFVPASESVLARLIDPASAVAPASRPAEILAPCGIVGWNAAIDYPHYEDLENAGVELSDDEIDAYENDFPVEGDKLGGWPAWVQGSEFTDCSKCGKEMDFVFQIDSKDNLPYMFGDLGTGHLQQCANHQDEMSFHWACC